MRGSIWRAFFASLGLWFIAEAAPAAEPQFTGLLNTYSSADLYFAKLGNSLAVMTPSGPIDVTPLDDRWSDIVVPPDNHAWYTLTHHEVFKIDPATGLATLLVIEVPLPPGEDTSWTVGATWDSARDRLVVATLAGTGFLFGYFNTNNQWTLISDLQNTDLRAIAYRPANDTIYAIPNDPTPDTTELFKYDAAGQLIGTLPLSQPLTVDYEQGEDTLEWQMMLASDGQLAVISQHLVFDAGLNKTVPGSWLYLINPDTGAITHSAPLPVPEPGLFGLALAGFGLLLRTGVRVR